MALIVLDASVVIAHLDPDDALHDAARRSLLEYAAEDLRLPASAYAESLVGPAREGRIDEARVAIERMQLQVVPLDGRHAERAAAIRARRRSVRLADALVLACGDLLSADVILSADRRWRRYPRVRLVG